MIIAVSLSFCIIASLLQPALQANVASSVAGRVGETVTGAVSNEAMLMLSYDITGYASLPYRISTHAPQANLSHPVFVSVRQGRRITAWTIPYIEDSHGFLRVERTLCPVLNSLYNTNTTGANDNTTTLIYIDISSPAPYNQTLTLSLDYLDDYKLSINSSIDVTVSAPSPVFHVYEFPDDSEEDEVMITVTSDSDVCAIVSVQDGLCPNDLLVEYPSHRGVYQTMERLSAITYNRPAHQDFFYVVVTIVHDDWCKEVTRELVDGLVLLNVSAQFNPVSIHSGELYTDPKNITISIKPTLSKSQYWMAPLASFVVYFTAYLFTLGWIFVEWLCYYRQNQYRMFKQWDSEQTTGGQYSQSYEDVDGKGRVPSNHVAPIANGGCGHTTRKVELKRPKFIAVLKGTNWSSEIGRRTHTPSPKDADYINRQFIQALTSAYPNPVPKLPHPLTNGERKPSDSEPLLGEGGGESPDHVLPDVPASRQMSCPEKQRGSVSPTSAEFWTPNSKSISNASDAVVRSPPPFGRKKGKSESHDYRTVSFHSPIQHALSYDDALNQDNIPSLLAMADSQSSLNPPEFHTHTLDPHAPIPEFPSHTPEPHSHVARSRSHASESHTLEPRSQSARREHLAQYPLENNYNSIQQIHTHAQEPRSHVSVDNQAPPDTPPFPSSFSDSTTPTSLTFPAPDQLNTNRDISPLSSPGHTPSRRPALFSLSPRATSHFLLEKITMSDLPIPEGKHFQKRYEGYWAYIVAVVLFYAIPTYQLLLTYQKYLNYSGNEDFCYYNTLCSHRLGVFSAFNNIWSNIGFMMLGILFLVVAKRRREKYRYFEEVNEAFESSDNKGHKIGIPQHFGIYYAIGVALMGEAVMSAAYHICPTSSNYQFDTTMMFVLVTLGLYKLYECRNPDKYSRPHKLLLVLALMILFIGMGVLYSDHLWFYVVFFVTFEAVSVYTALQNYYRWIKIWPLKQLKEVVLELVCNVVYRPFPIQHKIKFVYTVLSIVVNMLWGLYLLVMRPEDFGTHFLAIMISNFLSSLVYYAIAKLKYRECHKSNPCSVIRPLLYLTASLILWVIGIVLYYNAVTNWLKSPSGSRNDNEECILMGFFDSHDLWHFVSAFALFFSFMLLMTLDDNQEGINRNKLHIF